MNLASLILPIGLLIASILGIANQYPFAWIAILVVAILLLALRVAGTGG